MPLPNLFDMEASLDEICHRFANTMVRSAPIPTWQTCYDTAKAVTNEMKTEETQAKLRDFFSGKTFWRELHNVVLEKCLKRLDLLEEDHEEQYTEQRE